jgi:hypothetical protein
MRHETVMSLALLARDLARDTSDKDLDTLAQSWLEIVCKEWHMSSDDAPATAYESIEEWERVLHGDKELFRRITDALISTLLESARQGIKDEKAKGNFLDVRPDELVGETLVQA